MGVNTAKFFEAARRLRYCRVYSILGHCAQRLVLYLHVYSPSTPEPRPLLTTIRGPGTVRLQISRLEIGTCSAVVPECWSASQCPWMSHKYGSLHMCGIVHVATSQSTGLIKDNKHRTAPHNTAIHAGSNGCKTSRTHKVASFSYCGCLLF